MSAILLAAVLGGVSALAPLGSPTFGLLTPPKVGLPGEPILKRYDLKYAPPQATAEEAVKRFPTAQCVRVPSENAVFVLAAANTQFEVQQWLAEFDEKHGPTN